MVKTIRQKVKFKTSPKEIYEMLMDSKKHSTFTESKAKIIKRIGGKIYAYDDWIEGENLELVPNKKIVQKWRGKDWPKGYYSTAKFELKKDKNGETILEFTQTDIPEKYYKLINKGWKEYYWNKMKNLLKKE